MARTFVNEADSSARVRDAQAAVPVDDVQTTVHGHNAETTIPVSVADTTIRTRLERSSGLLLCLDFDGTLTPIAASPADPVITRANARVLTTLGTHPATRIAIISGRALSDLRSRVGISNIVYAGNHGLELFDGDVVTVHPEAARQAPAIQWAASRLEAALSSVPGATVENKRLSLTVHYRRVPPERVPEVMAAVDGLERAAVHWFGNDTATPYRIAPGKQSVEIRPAVQWDKGDAVDLLESRVPDDWVTVYVGDDTTDEAAFAVLDMMDVDVFVGPGQTSARYRLPRYEAVTPFLEWLAYHVETLW